MKTKLITALRVAANSLEKETWDYDWGHPETCNCGVVVAAMLGKSQQTLRNILPNGMTTWKKLCGSACPVTGIPTDQIFGELHRQGMTPEDIVDLEYLENEEVLKRCDFGSSIQKRGCLWWKSEDKVATVKNFKNKEHVVIYLRAWANLLSEQTEDDVPSKVSKEFHIFQKN